MRILTKDYKKGFVKLETNTLDDLWVLYNVIDKGDVVSGKTQRKIDFGTEKEKKTIFVKIEIEKTEFHKTSNVLRLNGKILEGPEDIPLGSYHTINVDTNKQIGIEKSEFKNYQVEKIERAIKDTHKPKLLLSVFEPGNADFALLRGWGFDYLGSLNELVEGKEMAEQMEKSKDYFYKQYIKSLLEIIKTHNVERVVLGSVSLYQDEFKKYITDSEIKDKVQFTNVSTIGKTGLNEIVKKGVASQAIKDERFFEETQLIEKLMAEIGKESLAVYGLEETRKAVDYGAVDIILVTDNLISKYKEEDNFSEIETLMKNTESTRGKVEIISSEHDAGKMLDNLGGVAALLRFRI